MADRRSEVTLVSSTRDLTLKLETAAKVGSYGVRLFEQVFVDLQAGLAVAGFALPDNCIAISTDRALRASSTLAPVAVQPACRCGNTGLFRVADQVMPEGQPFAGLSQNARFDKLCGPALPALERTTSWAAASRLCAACADFNVLT